MAEETALKAASPPQPGNEIATATNDPFNYVWDGLLRSQDETLLTRGGGQGLKIYEQLRRDPHCASVLQKRELALVSREWSVEAASTSRVDKKAAETVKAVLDSLPFSRICKKLLDATLKGYAVAEIIWAPQAAGVPIQAIKAKSQRRFVFDLEHRPRLLTLKDLVRGEELPERKFIVHRYGESDDDAYGLGLGHILFWPVFFKRKGISFWLTFVDKFASPTAVGKYPAGTDDTAKRNLLRALQAIAQEACVTVPSGMEVELLEAARSGSIDSYERLCRYMDEQMSKAVLGEIHTTGGGASGMGSGRDQVANEVRLEITKADADLLADTLNATLVKWIVEFNCPGASPPKLSWDVSEPEDLKARAERDKLLTEIGLEPDDDYIKLHYTGWRRKAGEDQDGEGEEIANLAAGDGNDAIDKLTGVLEARSQAALNKLMEPIKRLVQNAASLQEIRDGMEVMFAELPSDQLAVMMREALAVAHLIGRVEVASEQ